jgi:hypothetical protein
MERIERTTRRPTDPDRHVTTGECRVKQRRRDPRELLDRLRVAWQRRQPPLEQRTLRPPGRSRKFIHRRRERDRQLHRHLRNRRTERRIRTSAPRSLGQRPHQRRCTHVHVRRSRRSRLTHVRRAGQRRTVLLPPRRAITSGRHPPELTCDGSNLWVRVHLPQQRQVQQRRSGPTKFVVPAHTAPRHESRATQQQHGCSSMQHVPRGTHHRPRSGAGDVFGPATRNMTFGRTRPKKQHCSPHPTNRESVLARSDAKPVTTRPFGRSMYPQLPNITSRCTPRCA